MMLSTLGHFTLAHTDSSVRVQRERGETNRLLGVNSRLIGREEIAELCPELNMSNDVAYPIQAALYHPPGATLRHDAVVWGYATGADQQGRAPAPGCRGDRHPQGRERPLHGRRHDAGPIDAGIVHLGRRRLDDADLRHGGHPHADHQPPAAGVRDRAGEADAAQDPGVGEPARVRLADRSRRVSDRLGDRAVHDVQLPLHVHVHQHSAANALDLVPQLARLKILRQWTGLLRHDARLLADHGRDRGGELLPRRRLGHVGLQGHRRLRRDDGRDGRDPQDARADRRRSASSRFADEMLVPEKAAASVSH